MRDELILYISVSERKKKKVTLSVDEKQKGCGFLCPFIGRPRCRRGGLAERGFVIGEQTPSFCLSLSFF